MRGHASTWQYGTIESSECPCDSSRGFIAGRAKFRPSTSSSTASFIRCACVATGRRTKAFAQKNGAWIAARLRRLPQAAPFAPGATLPLRGEPHRIEHRPSARGTVWAEAGEDGAHMLCVAGDRAHLARRVGDYLKRAAKHDLQASCRRYAADLGVTVKRVSVRDQTSRWGSCSSTGVLSFSWRLILAPPFVLDYLAAHEVAHLIEMNHSRRFWRLLLRACPATHRAKVWLNVHGADLHRYGEPQLD